MNLTVLRGHLRRAPESRTLASGDLVVGYDLVAGRAGQRAEPVPVVWHDPPAAALTPAPLPEPALTAEPDERAIAAADAFRAFAAQRRHRHGR